MRFRARAILFALTLLLPLLLAACGGHHQPFKTLPPPPLHGQQAPSCGSGENHALGDCLPQPGPQLTRPRPQSSAAARCVDTSNNDPITTLSGWQAVRRAGFVCAYVKVNEGTGFVDRYARSQAALARRAGLTVGGYDFQHVCTADAASEARLFARLLVADGLTGAGSLPGVADTEYPSSTSCNTRSWENTWHATADRALGRGTGTYTGEWWWGPHIGCWWEGSFSWISGYVSSLSSVPRVCTHSTVDLWQYTDRQFNGSNTSDASAWVSLATYRRFANVKPPPPPPPPDTQHYKVLTRQELAVVKLYDVARFRLGSKASEVTNLEHALAKLSHAIWVVAHAHGQGGFAARNRGLRFQVVYRRSLGQEVCRAKVCS